MCVLKHLFPCSLDDLRQVFKYFKLHVAENLLVFLQTWCLCARDKNCCTMMHRLECSIGVLTRNSLACIGNGISPPKKKKTKKKPFFLVYYQQRIVIISISNLVYPLHKAPPTCPLGNLQSDVSTHLHGVSDWTSL